MLKKPLKITGTLNSFDIVVFKSVIGALGSPEKQAKAISEIHRILKPGGVLLFAENLKGSWFHGLLRKLFVTWASYWYYPSISEMKSYLSIFKSIKYRSTGLLSCFIRNEGLRQYTSKLDAILEKLLSKDFRYIIYGAAIK